jgi:pyridoxamine 5'-phosphate oxidase
MLEKMNNTPNIQAQYPPYNLVTRVWQELARATKDRHHHWKTPILASIGLDGYPQARTIVLRHADQAQWILDAYTDLRSPKCHELVKDNRAHLVFWSAKLRWQLRVSVNTSVHLDGEYVRVAWARMSRSKSSKDYLRDEAPGSAISSNNVDGSSSVSAPNNHYLAVLRFQVISMDWLELGRDIHRRTHIDSNGVVTTLTP